MDAHVLYLVSDASHPGEVRRAAVALASALGFGDSDVGRVAVVATELATNIIKHAARGRILLRPVRKVADQPGVELLALDQGPGIADIARCMRDGFSTAGSPGTGLGAISRLSSFMDIYSVPSRGTAVLVRILPQRAKLLVAESPFVVGVVGVASPGETECGDDWAFYVDGSRARAMIADGLGHGSRAAEAAAEAVRLFHASTDQPLPDVLQRMHGALLATRGAAVSLAELELSATQVSFAGVGNVNGFVAWPGGSRNMVTHNGTVGSVVGRVRVFSYPWTRKSFLVLYSDGLNSHTSTNDYPGLLARHPSLIAGVLYRDFERGRDDATVLVVAMEEQAEKR